MMSDVQFPQYRRYQNRKSWFCLLKPGVWVEVRVLGHRYSIQEHHAQQYPEKVWFSEMLEGREGVEAISRHEYDGFLLECTRSFTLTDF
jgi:hypothetical protein